jgi:hypothetical protein
LTVEALTANLFQPSDNQASWASLMEPNDNDMAPSVFASSCWRKIDSPAAEAAGEEIGCFFSSSCS